MLVPKLSVAIITFNEASNIQDCLDSVAGIADEIVVLDSLSTDNTKKICEANPKVRFYQNPFHGHVQQKNLAIDYCTYPWVLSVDADERVTESLRQSILRFLQSDDVANYVGVKFPRLTYHLGKAIRHGGWYPNARYRLFKKDHAHWGGENPHDKIILDGKGYAIQGDLIHYSFLDLSHQVATINNFSSIAAYGRYHKGRRFALLRLMLKPLSKFIEVYLIKRGFLDGTSGFIIAVSSSYSAFLKEAKLYELDCLGIEKPSNLPRYYQNQQTFQKE